MTQEEKSLLLKDLCARLPYKQHIYIKDEKVDVDIDTILDGAYIHEWVTLPSCQNVIIKPYLRPMSSMTREEHAYYFYYQSRLRDGILGTIGEYLDWLITNHFDYRGLIPMGLALEAKEGMYKF